jgi:formylglycine-generating enzyme required for sulfatase activity
MKPVLSFIILLASTIPASAITIPTVPVDDVGNPNDPATGNLYGGVSTPYNIGTTEVTIGQYTAFLSAVAATDTYQLYNLNMSADLHVAGIQRTGSTGSFSYTPIGSPDRPITNVSWGDAARFANWMHNGQPTGPEGPGTTETGAYTLNGLTTAAALMAVTRNPGARWFIPTENEWYKAAYYQPTAAGGDSDGYWAYPMKTNSTPYSDQPPGATPDNTRVANVYTDDSTANGYNDGYAVTGTTFFGSNQNVLTDAGAYTSSTSYYGTFDQAGNVAEWNETGIGGSARGVRGGSWFLLNAPNMQASIRSDASPFSETNMTGFRVASYIPEPGCFALCLTGMLMLALRRGKK